MAQFFANQDDWRPSQGAKASQTEEGMATFLACLYATSHVLASNRTACDRFLELLHRLLVDFPPAVRAFKLLVSRVPLAPIEAAAISQAVYTLVREQAGSNAGPENKTFEQCRVFFAFMQVASRAATANRSDGTTFFEKDEGVEAKLAKKQPEWSTGQITDEYTQDKMKDPVQFQKGDGAAYVVCDRSSLPEAGSATFSAAPCAKTRALLMCHPTFQNDVVVWSQEAIAAHEVALQHTRVGGIGGGGGGGSSTASSSSAAAADSAVLQRPRLRYQWTMLQQAQSKCISLCIVAPLSLPSATIPSLCRDDRGLAAVLIGRGSSAAAFGENLLLLLPTLAKEKGFDAQALATKHAQLGIEVDDASAFAAREPKEAIMFLLDVSGSMGSQGFADDDDDGNGTAHFVGDSRDEWTWGAPVEMKGGELAGGAGSTANANAVDSDADADADSSDGNDANDDADTDGTDSEDGEDDDSPGSGEPKTTAAKLAAANDARTFFARVQQLPCFQEIVALATPGGRDQVMRELVLGENIEYPEATEAFKHLSRFRSIAVKMLSKRSADQLASGQDEVEQADDNMLPDNFRCPITCCLMHDPVITSDGFTYERSAIEEWFATADAGATPKSPMTGSAMAGGLQLTPNRVLKSMIQTWLDSSANADDDAEDADELEDGGAAGAAASSSSARTVEINVTIQGTGERLNGLRVRKSMSILALRRLVAQQSQTNIYVDKVLFRGRSRKNHETVEQLRLKDGDTLTGIIPRTTKTTVTLLFRRGQYNESKKSLLVKPNERVIDLKFRIWSIMKTAQYRPSRVHLWQGLEAGGDGIMYGSRLDDHNRKVLDYTDGSDAFELEVRGQ